MRKCKNSAKRRCGMSLFMLIHRQSLLMVRLFMLIHRQSLLMVRLGLIHLYLHKYFSTQISDLKITCKGKKRRQCPFCQKDVWDLNRHLKSCQKDPSANFRKYCPEMVAKRKTKVASYLPFFSSLYYLFFPELRKKSQNLCDLQTGFFES